jgi:hypothetical protein
MGSPLLRLTGQDGPVNQTGCPPNLLIGSTMGAGASLNEIAYFFIASLS